MKISIITLTLLFITTSVSWAQNGISGGGGSSGGYSHRTCDAWDMVTSTSPLEVLHKEDEFMQPLNVEFPIAINGHYELLFDPDSGHIIDFEFQNDLIDNQEEDGQPLSIVSLPLEQVKHLQFRNGDILELEELVKSNSKRNPLSAYGAYLISQQGMDMGSFDCYVAMAKENFGEGTYRDNDDWKKYFIMPHALRNDLHSDAYEEMLKFRPNGEIIEKGKLPDFNEVSGIMFKDGHEIFFDEPNSLGELSIAPASFDLLEAAGYFRRW